jgi:hypothetical protein
MKFKTKNLCYSLIFIILMILMSGIQATAFLPVFSKTDTPLISNNNNSNQSVLSTIHKEQLSQALSGKFLENLGQVSNHDILYYTQFSRVQIGFGTNKIYLWADGWITSITITFTGTQTITPLASEPLAMKSNFFLGEERGTYTDVQYFKTISYNDLWPGIDLIFYGTTKGLSYQFNIAPYAEPELITFQIEDYNNLNFNDKVSTFLEDNLLFFDTSLTTYQADGHFVSSQLIRKEANSFGLQLDSYDNFQQLSTESILYSTLVGGNEWDEALDIVIDADNNAYVTGYTWSTDFPTSDTANNKTLGGECDVFVFKLNADGSDLIYSTYIGGYSWDEGKAITLDSENNAYVTGYTLSDDFPTSADAYNKTREQGGSDAFILKLSPDGSDLLYSTFFGGYSQETAWDIALDDSNNIYITGETASEEDFITTANAFNRTFGGYSDGFLSKFSADGSTLLYSSYIGGWEDDFPKGLALDSENNAYITGYTYSFDFPTTDGAFNQTYGDWEDVFIAKLSTEALTYSILH